MLPVAPEFGSSVVCKMTIDWTGEKIKRFLLKYLSYFFSVGNYGDWSALVTARKKNLQMHINSDLLYKSAKMPKEILSEILQQGAHSCKESVPTSYLWTPAVSMPSATNVNN